MSKDLAELYEEYKIMPQLAAHQLRVAAVAHVIARSFQSSLHTEELISACLLHDMGNILKFDLAYFPQFLEPQGFAYWQDVKAEFQVKYGTDEHLATLSIAREIGVSERTLSYIEAIGFGAASENEKGSSLEKKIACYADMRVAPLGIVSLRERLEEGNRRYRSRPGYTKSGSYLSLQTSALEAIEQQIFSYGSITPGDITEETCEKYFSSLQNYKIV
jgi:hypothetical protein